MERNTIMMTTTTTLETLGYSIEARGISADPISLSLLARDARDIGVNAVLVDVMVDESQPAVARVRAFGRVSSTVDSALRQGFAPAKTRELAYAC
jgi:hypothetical protein